MNFDIRFTPSADADLDYYEAREQRIILSAVERCLRYDADVSSKRRKRLRANLLAPWELRVGDYRVFYQGDCATMGNMV
jgi:mRNA interferase RelE/StbE